MKRILLAILCLAFPVQAQQIPSFISHPHIAPVTAQWSAVNKNPDVVISGGGLTATITSPAGSTAGLGNTAITLGFKKYIEITIAADDGNMIIGLGNSSTSFSDFLGVNTNSIGLRDDGSVIYNFGVPATYTGYTVGDVLCIAVDYSNGTVWWRTNGGNWNNDPSANPSTNIGGQTIGVTGALFWAYGFGSGTNYSAIAKFTAPFTYTPPPGFTGQ